MNQEDTYLDLRLTAENQASYFVRGAIQHALERVRPRFHGTLLDVGAGLQPYRQLVTAPPSRVERYVALDLAVNEMAAYRKKEHDLEWDGITIPLGADAVECAMATEVLEHCPAPESVMREIHRVLKADGIFFFTVPFLWPLHDVPYDEYRYTPFALERMLRAAGFAEVELSPHGGWDASLATMLGLWARRRPMSVGKRRVISAITKPIVRYLLKHDHVPDLRSAPMITGISGVAIKRNTA
ncbi:MAG: class I SAM-dependent methyltransferase [Flavobacteriales bacterium]|nr:class I SAM-dependent methyltransferase [Flavobacteriales bacterium]